MSVNIQCVESLFSNKIRVEGLKVEKEQKKVSSTIEKKSKKTLKKRPGCLFTVALF